MTDEITLTLWQYARSLGWALVAAISFAIAMGLSIKVFDWMSTEIDEWEEIKKGNLGVALIIVAISQRLYPVQYETRRLVVMIVVFVGAALAGRVIEWGSLPVTLAGKTALLLIGVPLALISSGFVDADERRVLRAVVARIVPR